MFNSSCPAQLAVPGGSCYLFSPHPATSFALPFGILHSTQQQQHTDRAQRARLLLATQLSLAAIYISLPIFLLSASYRLYNGQRGAAIFHLIYRTFYLCTFYCPASCLPCCRPSLLASLFCYHYPVILVPAT